MSETPSGNGDLPPDEKEDQRITDKIADQLKETDPEAAETFRKRGQNPPKD